MDLQQAREIIVNFISESVKNSASNGVVVGLSGGVDSALVAYLSVEALGKDKVLGIHLPELSFPCSKDMSDAANIAQKLDIDFKVVDITNIINSFLKDIPDGNMVTPAIKGNLKARARMSILYYYANLLNRMVIGTGNKTELLIGYFTKYGDGGVDLLPIGDLLKTDVWCMSSLVGVSESIITKLPSAGLWNGQTDEKELGIDYKKLDKFIMFILKGETPEIARNLVGITKQQAEYIIYRIRINAHKVKTPPIPNIEAKETIDWEIY